MHLAISSQSSLRLRVPHPEYEEESRREKMDQGVGARAVARGGMNGTVRRPSPMPPMKIRAWGL
jgi:hypothetical protein